MRLLATLLFITTLTLPSTSYSIDFFDNIKKAGQLSDQVKKLEEENSYLKDEIDNIKSRLNGISTPFENRVFMTPSSSGYSVLAFQSGLLILSCENIKNYASGSELYIEVINATSVILTNVKLKIEYSSTEFSLKDPEAISNFFAGLKKGEEIIREARPGISTIIKFRLPEYKSDEIKFLSFTAEPGGLRYTKGSVQ